MGRRRSYIYVVPLYVLWVFRFFSGSPHDAHERKKLIESIYSKNNNYLLIYRAYDDDKTLTLAKAHRFKTVVPPKKESQVIFINSATISNDIF